MLCLGSAGQAQDPPKEHLLSSLLPDGPELEGWAKEGDHQFFEGDDLFIYIDGGAEIYFEYGFGRVIVQDYKKGTGSRLSLEIFEMESPEAAYGMFTFKSSPRGEPVVLGDEGQLADYYLNFWKGRYLITITGLDPEASAKEDLVSLARLVDKKLEQRGQRPGLVSELPEDGLKPNSLRFFKGPLALYNSYPFFREDVFAFQSGIKGEYANGSTLFLFEYSTDKAAGRRFSEARSRFSAEPKYRNIQWDGELLVVQDEKGRAIYARLSGRFILIVLGNNHRETAEILITRTEKHLAN